MKDMEFCKYCNSSDHTLESNLECKVKYDKFEGFAKRYRRLSWASVVLFFVVSLLYMFLIDEYVGMGVFYITLGLNIAIFPICTQEMLEIWGVKGTRRLGKVSGALMAIIIATFAYVY